MRPLLSIALLAAGLALAASLPAVQAVPQTCEEIAEDLERSAALLERYQYDAQGKITSAAGFLRDYADQYAYRCWQLRASLMQEPER